LFFSTTTWDCISPMLCYTCVCGGECCLKMSNMVWYSSSSWCNKKSWMGNCKVFTRSFPLGSWH
jgi:hypothetical protein